MVNKINLIVIFEEFAFWLFPENTNRNGELFKIFLSILGSLGILFGLFVSLRRAKAMEKGVQEQREAIKIQGEQISISRKAQTDERFKNAVEHLGSEKEPIILGGVAELHQIAKENNTEYAEIVFNILCSYIRSNANIYKKTAEDINTTVIQTIVNNLFKPTNFLENTYSGLYANLRHSNLNSINFDNANLENSNFSFCYMPDLNGTNLEDSNLTRAEFTLSDLIDINFEGANLHQTVFHAATLENINMGEDTKLLSTYFIDSQLKNVNFNNNNVSGCKIIATEITDSKFNNCEIVASNFMGSGLSNIDLSHLSLFGTNDFRATGFINVKIDTIVTQTKFNGCRHGESLRYNFADKIKKIIGQKANLKGINLLSSRFSNCDTGELTNKDIDEMIQEYDKGLAKKISNEIIANRNKKNKPSR